MNEKQTLVIGILFLVFLGFVVIINIVDNKTINSIKSKTIGDGQHGTARWASRHEVERTFTSLPFTPERWRKGEGLPKIQGTIVMLAQVQ